MEEPLHGRRTNLLRLAGYFSIAILGVILAAYFVLNESESRSAFLDIVSPIVDFLAALLLFTAAKITYRRSKHLSIAWGVIALSLLFYTLGDGYWAILELVFGREPFPSLADGFYLAYYPAFLIGVFLMQEKLTRRREWANKVIDAGIVILAASLGYWNFLIGPTIQTNIGLPFLEQAILLAYPTGDLVLFLALLVIIYNHSHEQDETSILLLAGSLLVIIITDSAYSYQSLLGTYASGGFLDLGWIVSMLLAGLAGASQLVSAISIKNKKRLPAADWILTWLREHNLYLPYIWLGGAFVLLIYSGLRKLPMGFLSLSLSVGGIVALVLIRQIITLYENRNLNTQLQSTNLELQNEIAERERIEVQLSYDSLHDTMTGLANRTLFLDRLGQAIEFAKRGAVSKFAVLFIDLDKFKIVNDSLGHLMGDQLLISIAHRLKESLRSCDTIARFGGDEFEILLDVAPDENSVRLVADKVLKVIQTPIRLEGHEVYINASMGIIMDLSGYSHAEDALRDADIAMYDAKALGGGYYIFFNVEMRHRAYVRLEMENEIRVGLKNNEFQLYYQPVFLLDSKHLIGFEALLRWLHPEQGVLTPDDFLPVAEESGLILPIGDWVLETSCLQLKAWKEKFRSLQTASISVNISGRQLSQADFYAKVVSSLKTSGLGAEELRLEITENMLINNFVIASEIFSKLREIGVQLQIDDFGTGYSALGYLQHLPISAIKIDKTFIGEMVKNMRGAKLVRAIVSMAHELGLETIAEGIETDEQLNALRSLFCRYGQGYLLSKPLEPVAVEMMLARLEADGRR
jgi:diguanylate cyclase (GGDEF)-like protein